MRCYLGFFQEGINDADKAIEKSEDNVLLIIYFNLLNIGIRKYNKIYHF